MAFGAHAALEVYDSTCMVPKAPKHKWFFDSVKGDDILGDGSALKPWKSIGPVFAGTTIAAVPAVPATATTPAIPGKPLIYVGAKYQPIPSFYSDPVTHGRVWGNDPNAPIKPGDALELATGNYGALGYGVYTYGIHPADFLTIEPQAGAKPVFTGISLSGAGMLYMHDIKVQNAGNGGSLVSLGAQGAANTTDKDIAQFPAQDVIFDRMTFNSSDAIPSTLTADFWNVKPANGVWMYPFSTRCISVTNSTFTALATPVAIGGEKGVVKWNTINYFRDDGLDFYGNQLKLNYNKFYNSIATTPIHKDFFQGQIGRRLPGTTTNHYHDIEIDHNTMIGKTEAVNQFYTYTQGINTFDEDWTNLKATNNIIIAASCHGIGFGSVHGGEIGNNVVLHDLLTVTTGCTRGSIGAGGLTHESTVPTDNVRIHHNISQNIFVDLDHSNTWDNNILIGNEAQFTPQQNGVINWGYIPGPTDSNKLEKQLMGFLPAALRYDVRVVPGSMAATMKAGPQ